MKIILFLIYFISSFLYAQELEISGRIAVKGSSIHTYLTIASSRNHLIYKITNPNDFDLYNNQDKIINIRAEIVEEASTHTPAIVRVISLQPNPH
jgi:hypothetical protein